MRALHLRHIALIATLIAPPALAEGTLGTVRGNWAGASGEGYTFDAVLMDDNGRAHLYIWQSPDPAIGTSIPGFDKNAITARTPEIAKGSQRLELSESATSTTLLIITEATVAEGRMTEVIRAQFLDYQFTVIGYSYTMIPGAADQPAYACDVDLRANRRQVDGVESPLAVRGFGDDNLWYWGPEAAFKHGLCPAPKG